MDDNIYSSSFMSFVARSKTQQTKYVKLNAYWIIISNIYLESSWENHVSSKTFQTDYLTFWLKSNSASKKTQKRRRKKLATTIYNENNEIWTIIILHHKAQKNCWRKCWNNTRIAKYKYKCWTLVLKGNMHYIFTQGGQ